MARFYGHATVDGLDELWQDFIQIADDAVISYTEDVGVLVAVDREDFRGFLHSRDMLDSSGNSDSDIKGRAYRSARLPNLVVVRDITEVNGSPAARSCAAKAVCQIPYQFEIVFIAHARSACYYDA